MLYYPNWHIGTSASSDRYLTVIGTICGVIGLVFFFAIGYHVDGLSGALQVVAFMVGILGFMTLIIFVCWVIVWVLYILMLVIVGALPTKLKTILARMFAVAGFSLVALIIVLNIVSFIHDPAAWWAGIQDSMSHMMGCGSPGCF